MAGYLIKNVTVVNEGKVSHGDVWIREGRFERIAPEIGEAPGAVEVDGSGLHMLPGVIDDQVHFREPGATYKADIYTEAKAAVAGGVTSFMEMPNTKPQTVTQSLLDEKYGLGAVKSLANYSFYMGATNANLDEVLRTDGSKVCGVKVFMGSSTGNMLVDDPSMLEKLFAECPLLIATHCEDEGIIHENYARVKGYFGDDIPAEEHPAIRTREACLKSSSLAVDFARRHGTRLHVLHITTEEECALFEAGGDLREKRITAEVCVHHLTFSKEDYARLGHRIKCNPAIKEASDREALWKALEEGRLDVVATDHAPHTEEEKAHPYVQAPAGLPLVQFSLVAMLDYVKQGRLTLEQVVHKMAHAPAECFRISGRGYIREGYWADAVLVDLKAETRVMPGAVWSKCGWSPFEGRAFQARVEHTFVSGHPVYRSGEFDESVRGRRLEFDPVR